VTNPQPITHDGVLVIDKPPHITSHDVVNRLRRILKTRRIGHVGTLDPLATGVLPLVIGQATRLASLLSVGDKVYSAVFRLGIVTDTYDVTGKTKTKEIKGSAKNSMDLESIRAASREFIGTFHQAPPPFSAKKVRGVRAYRLARLQKPVELKPVSVTVRRLEIKTLIGNQLHCRVTCSPGFYMRSLAHDLGQALRCGACLESLRRERSGPFHLKQTTSVEQLELEGESIRQAVIPTAKLLPDLPSVIVTEKGSRLTSHGNSLTQNDFMQAANNYDKKRQISVKQSSQLAGVKVYDESGNLLAIAEGSLEGILQPRIVLV